MKRKANKTANFCEVGERKMANNVNCEEMRFVIRNLVMLKILPGNGARNFFLMSLEATSVFLQRGKDDAAQRQ